MHCRISHTIVGTAVALVVPVGSSLLMPSVGLAVDTCKVRVSSKDGTIHVSASHISGALGWGDRSGSTPNAFANAATCIVGAKATKCELGAPGSAQAITPPDLCRVYLKDDGPECAAFIKGCTPGVRPTDAAKADALKGFVDALSFHHSVPTTVITGNLQIISGSGATDGPVNGGGNLIIGYNEDNVTPNDRSGSHNLIIGPLHTYSSFGGLVAGDGNSITGEHASVTGGTGNLASGRYASIGGGEGSVASGESAAVSGGQFNTASGFAASVSGGISNTASALRGSVSGGRCNRAGVGPQPSCLHGTGDSASSVSGGEKNQASGAQASVSGGALNVASNEGAWVGGGASNTASGVESSVSGGNVNMASGGQSSVCGGETNTASGASSSVTGGFINTASGILATVSGGESRSATGGGDWVAGALFQDN